MKKLYLVSEVLKVINNLIFIPMKTFTYFCRGLVALVAAAAFLASCSEDNPDGPDTPGGQSPELTISEEESDQRIDYKGGDRIIVYYVSNPAEDGHVTAAVDADAASWVTKVTVDETNGLVAFNVAANLGQTSREAKVTVTYAWGDKEQPKTVTVLQEGAPAGDPFTFSVTDITHNSAKVTVTPADTEMDYLVMCWQKDEYEQLSGTADQLYQNAMTVLAAEADNEGYEHLQDYLEAGDVLYRGKATIDLTEYLEPETQYVAFAIGTTTDVVRLTDVVTSEFTTTQAPQLGITFTFEYNNPIITVTSSDENAFIYAEAIFDVVLDTEGSVEQYVERSWDASLNSYMGYPHNYTLEESINMICSRGEMDAYIYGDGSYFVYAFSTDVETGEISDLAYEFFTVTNGEVTVTPQE